VEFLPSNAEMKKLEHDGKGLTRPELAVLLAYAKLDLDAELLASALPADPALHDLLTGYFPPAAIAAFPGEPGRHRLKTEIVSTVLTNRLVNLAGPFFVLRMKELSGQGAATIARAFVIADGAFGLSALKARLDATDGTVDAKEQIAAYAAIAAHLQRVVPWLLNRKDGDIQAAIGLYRGGVEALRPTLARGNEKTGLPADLAHDIASLPLLADAPDIATLAAEARTDPARAAALHGAVGERLGLPRLRALAARLNLPEHWDRLAVRRLLDDLAGTQRNLTAKLLASGEARALDAWSRANREALARTDEFLAAIESAGELSVAKLLLAASQIQNLA
jgi:glutamate dehydrogenase